jgi:RNA polymerase sigma-70 factor (ECF subfamily)
MRNLEKFVAAMSLTPTLWALLERETRSFNSAPVTRAAPIEALSDEQLMQRYRGGDSDSFTCLYRRNCDRLHRFVLRMAANHAEADEIYQEVWIAVIQGKERYTPNAKFVTYLFAIAHRRAIDRMRRNSRAGEEFERALFDADQLIDEDEPEPSDVAYRIGAGRALSDAIANLPVLQREALLLQTEGGLSIDEIAQAAGTSRETAKSRLRYATRRLRTALEAWR